ncbi:MAG TPA: glycerate kinase [Flavisolibacter sp.]|nr:glycerate kinase [Flavisolibacter sp.]
MNILIAPNAFKNSLDAEAAACAIEAGLQQSKLAFSSECFPIADGGDGTGYLITKRCGGNFYETEVHDPLGRAVTASFGLIDENNTAVIEMANASGLRLLKTEELKPLQATSFGTGEQIKYALDKGVKNIILCIGGSAVVDGGTGILSALGVRFLDIDGNKLTGLPENLHKLHTINVSEIDRRLAGCQIIILCDVSNPLLGEQGAAAIFGPQKGASAEEVETLEKSLSRFAEVTLVQSGKDISGLKHGGAAGGTAAGLYAFLNAKLVNGIDYFLELTGFESALKKHDLVITGEGSLDEQTLQGKGPYGVAYRAKAQGIPVIGIAGKVPLIPSQKMNEYFDVCIPIGNEPSDILSALQATEVNLKRASKEIGNLLALKQGKQ